MDTIYYEQEKPLTWSKSIFLAGPSPRGKEQMNWRPEAIRILEKLGYDGVVFLPLPPESGLRPNYDDQVQWETEHLNMADIIVFWVPRDLESLPAFTTNIEFGLWKDSGKVILGHPDNAKKMGVMRWHSERSGIPIAATLEETLKLALERLGKGAERTGAEREVPLHIWKTVAFQNWYKTQKAAGNRLDGAKVLWHYEGGKGATEHPFAWALKVNVFIKSESRNKTNEFVLSRPDTCSVCAYYPAKSLKDSEVLLVREFRSPGTTVDGFIHELPGGSAKSIDQDTLSVAKEELAEETGLDLPDERFQYISSRQVAGTFSSHRNHLFVVRLSKHELEELKKRDGQVLGQESDSERTYVEIKTIKQLLAEETADWANLGLIWKAVFSTD